MARLGLELHPDKTRRIELYDGKQGFDFLGCHFRKRLSGKIWEHERRRVYFLHRQPSQRAMTRIRQKVKDRTPRGRCHADFATGDAARSFNQIDSYVAGRQLVPGAAEKWDRDYFVGLGLHRLRGTVAYPETTQYRWTESSPASRVREIRKHGFYGGRTEPLKEGK